MSQLETIREELRRGVVPRTVYSRSYSQVEAPRNILEMCAACRPDCQVPKAD